MLAVTFGDWIGELENWVFAVLAITMVFAAVRVVTTKNVVHAALYLVITGAPIPTQRSFIMTGIVFAAILLDRTALSMRLVALAAIIILVFRPESLNSESDPDNPLTAFDNPQD